MKRHIVDASPNIDWLEQRMAKFDEYLCKADDVALGPSGKLLRQVVRVEQTTNFTIESAYYV